MKDAFKDLFLEIGTDAVKGATKVLRKDFKYWVEDNQKKWSDAVAARILKIFKIEKND